MLVQHPYKPENLAPHPLNLPISLFSATASLLAISGRRGFIVRVSVPSSTLKGHDTFSSRDGVKETTGLQHRLSGMIERLLGQLQPWSLKPSPSDISQLSQLLDVFRVPIKSLPPPHHCDVRDMLIVFVVCPGGVEPGYVCQQKLLQKQFAGDQGA